MPLVVSLADASDCCRGTRPAGAPEPAAAGGVERMTIDNQGSGKRPAAQQRLPTLGQRTDLPPRVRNLLDGLNRQAVGYFQPLLTRALTDIENALFQLAERAGNSGEQQRHFEALRALKDARANVLPRFERRIEADLAEARRGGDDAATATAPTKATRSALELVDSAVLEEDLALKEIAGKADVRNSQALNAFAHRFAVIAGAAVAANEALPLGPARLTEAFRHALADAALDLEHRVFAYRQIDRAIMMSMAPFYERVNAWLASQKVLPNLQQPGFRRSEHPFAGRSADAPDEQPPAEEAPADEATPATARAPGQAPRAAAGEAPLTRAEREFYGPALFNTLRDLLGARRRAEGLPHTEPAHPASSSDLQSVLGALQRAPMPASQQGRYDSEHFRNTLQVKLRRASPEGRPLDLGEEDGDTVDLIGMLFDYVTRNVREGSGARSLLTRLHVPVLRVALGDKSFFTRRDHPARELLNAIAETGARWFDESDTDPDLAAKMQMVVDHVSNDFDGDTGVFESMLGDLTRHMQTLARRAEAAERRHIDAARGRDRLDIARGGARAAMTRLLQSTRPPERVRSLLEQAWTDALALSALRDGTEGAEFKRRVEVAEHLAGRGSKPFDVASPVDDGLRQDLESGLHQVGLHDDDVRGLVDNLFSQAPGSATDERLKRIDEALREKPRLGSEAHGTAHPRTAEPKVPLTPAEEECLATLRKTPFGTWFEFVRNQQGETVRRKLAWFSPVTGHCLFVNQRGARADDFTLELLAREMARGQARIAATESTSIIDRAWKAIVDLLKPHADATKGQPAVAGARA